MKRTELVKTARVIADEFKTLFQIILEDNGENIRAGKNTLAPDSDLYKTLKKKSVVYTDSVIVELFVNNYIEYIERGRPAHIDKVPIYALLKWAKRKGLPTDNSFLYAVQNTIYKNGIRPRPILYYFWQEVQKEWENWADKIFQAIYLDFINSVGV